MRMFVVFCVLGLAVGAYGQPLEWQDDFMTAHTYDFNDILAPCYAGPAPKYTVFEALGVIGTNRGVTGQRRYTQHSPQSALYRAGQMLSSDNTTLGGGGLEDARFNFIQLGWVGLGTGCPGEPPLKTSTAAFTSPDICIYAGFELSPWDLEFQRPSSTPPNYRNCDRLVGNDGLPGVPGVDDDQDGTTDGTIGDFNIDDDLDGFTDEWAEVPDCDESPAYRPAGTASGYAGPNTDGGTIYKAGLDAAPGIAGVDDDGNGLIDEYGETGSPGSDDGDDTYGRLWPQFLMKVNMITGSNNHVNIDPGSGGGNLFAIRYFHNLVEGSHKPTNEIVGGYYKAYTHYNFVWCNSNTMYGAALWKGQDVANPDETLGPFVDTFHSAGNDNGIAMSHAHGAEVYMRNSTWTGNSTFSDTFWVISGKAPAARPSHSADLDGDRDVDVNDFLTFSSCFNGALNPPNAPCNAADDSLAVNHADLDGDGDVDVNDFLTFSGCFNGALNPPKPLCRPAMADDIATAVAPVPLADPWPGDTCATANAIGETTCTLGNIGFSNTQTTEPGSPTCRSDDTGKEIWYEYTPTCTGTATIDTCGLSGCGCDPESMTFLDDPLLMVFDQCSPGETELLCREWDNCPGSSTSNTKGEVHSVPVVSGVPIIIVVQGEDFPFDGPSDSDLGCYELAITCTP